MPKKETVFPITGLGGRIQQIRITAGLDRKQFYDCVMPDESGITDDSKEKNVYNWESGKNKPSLEFIQSICKVFNCSADYLLGIIPERNYDHIKMINRTGLNEKSILLLERWNTDAFKYIAEIINYILEYTEIRINDIEMNFTDRLRQFLKYKSHPVGYNYRTSAEEDENGHLEFTKDNIFFDTVNSDDAAIIGINNTLRDMKKTWLNIYDNEPENDNLV